MCHDAEQSGHRHVPSLPRLQTRGRRLMPLSHAPRTAGDRPQRREVARVVSGTGVAAAGPRATAVLLLAGRGRAQAGRADDHGRPVAAAPRSRAPRSPDRCAQDQLVHPGRRRFRPLVGHHRRDGDESPRVRSSAWCSGTRESWGSPPTWSCSSRPGGWPPLGSCPAVSFWCGRCRRGGPRRASRPAAARVARGPRRLVPVSRLDQPEPGELQQPHRAGVVRVPGPPRAPGRSCPTESRSWLQTVLVVAASLIAAGAFLSYSRSFWLAAPIGCALALVLAGPPCPCAMGFGHPGRGPRRPVHRRRPAGRPGRPGTGRSGGGRGHPVGPGRRDAERGRDRSARG